MKYSADGVASARDAAQAVAACSGLAGGADRLHPTTGLVTGPGLAAGTGRLDRLGSPSWQADRGRGSRRDSCILCVWSAEVRISGEQAVGTEPTRRDDLGYRRALEL
jgi:hypothetical protein